MPANEVLPKEQAMLEIENLKPSTKPMGPPPISPPLPTQKMELTVHATASQEAAAMIAMIKEVALTPGANIEAIRAMLDMQRQLTKDQAERAFNEALARLSIQLPRVKKTGKVEYLVDKTKKDGPKEEAFKFAKYEDIDKAIRPLLAAEGFSLSFTTEPRAGDGGGLNMIGTLSHVQGHSRTSQIAVALDNSGGKNNIQGMGSSSSYGKRYVTCMLLNIITEGQDDDGNSAEPITLEQAADIDKRIRIFGEDYRTRFLKWAKVSLPVEIKSGHYKKVIAAIEAKEGESKPKKGAA